MAKKPGRPTDFVPETKEKILVAIKKGAPYEMACNYAGICYNTLQNWRDKAEQNIPEYVDFFKELKEAEGLTALVWLDKIDKAMANGAWQAAAWKLERRFRQHFGQDAGVIAELQQTFLELKAKIDEQEKAKTR